MVPLVPELRKILENCIPDARQAAEEAARAILNTLAVNRADPFPTMTPEQRRLRNALRAKARQLGGGSQHDGFEPLVEELAYHQWHRMVFARFLAENNLLMHPSGVPVSLQDCADLTWEEGEVDAWAVAAKYTALMLPGIFRPEDPEMQVRLAPEGQQMLEAILIGLPPAIFLADDALGWMYQFWQSRKKDEINKSERKIGSADIAPVTQLFTEDYMVRFMLENTLGAWWAAHHPDSSLIKEWEYLRFLEDGKPVAGTFPTWPKKAADVTIMDPCCGSGHFLVVAFDMMCKMRMEEEGLSVNVAGDLVIKENIFGLEIDLRCTQIAAFAMTVMAWKAGGYRKLPFHNLLCSGTNIIGQKSTWLEVCGNEENLRNILGHLYDLYLNAPQLGSLINPAKTDLNGPLFKVEFSAIEPFLEKALTVNIDSDDPTIPIVGNMLDRTIKAFKLMAKKYTLIVTNVPYLTIRKQADFLRSFCTSYYENAKADLATVFLVRCKEYAQDGGTYALLLPQNWTSFGSYKNLRYDLLTNQDWKLVVRLGAQAFQTPMWNFNVGMFFITNLYSGNNEISGLDISEFNSFIGKKIGIQKQPLLKIAQSSQLKNPDYRITFDTSDQSHLLSEYADCYVGVLNGDSPRFQKYFWEVLERKDLWVFQQSTVSHNQFYGGREKIIYFDEKNGHLRESVEFRKRLHDSDQRGNKAWGKYGVAISAMNDFPVTLYTGENFDSNVAVLLPKKPEFVPAIWAYCSSPEFKTAVRRIDQALKVTNATFGKVPFDLEYWQKVADDAGPLPTPSSNDVTQWLFNGNPLESNHLLHAATARLLGYQWPHQSSDPRKLTTDTDGILCLPAVFGEPTAAESLRTILGQIYGGDWSPLKQSELLSCAGSAGMTLEEWLCEDFFVQHCRLFLNRPFIWHIWDGRKDGFSALVNYHKLTTENLDRLIYTYLGDWINFQRARRDHGEPGADGRLVAALQLQEKLKLIREGEPPYDIYVRWKSLAEQPVGWDPDLNDGVRINIRPFVTAGVLRAKFNINWNKDRGKNPDGSERLNDLHFTRAQKLAARQGK